MIKKDRYYDLTNSLIMGILFILLSLILFIGRKKIYMYIIHFTIIILLLMVIGNLFRYIYRKQTKKQIHTNLLICIFNLLVCLILLLIPKLSYSILPVIFSIYLLIIGTSQLVMYILLIKNKEVHRFSTLILGIFYYFIAIPILISPYQNIDNFLSILIIYTFFLGLTYVYDFIRNIIPKKTKNELKRKIRITLPKIFEILIPYSVMLEVNKTLETKSEYTYQKARWKESSDLEVLIHTSKRGVNRIGHIDIIFEGIVYSYGNYNENSRKFFDFFGPGILFKTKNIEKYINFCIDNSKKTIFLFGIKLNEIQKQEVKKRIDELMNNTVPWNYKESIKKNEENSYASKLYKKTKAKFYKFKKGKYKTYFILGTNCCYLADDIIGHSGLDILSFNGIITPGTYYDYLNRQFYQKNSIVIYKEIYNEKLRPKRK